MLWSVLTLSSTLMSRQDTVAPRTLSPPTPTWLRLRLSRCVNFDRFESFGGVLTITGTYPVTAAEAGLEGVLSVRSGSLGRYGYL